MHWKQTDYGKALYLNGEIVGWVCKTINSEFTYLLCGQPSIKYKTQLEAEVKLMKYIGE